MSDSSMSDAMRSLLAVMPTTQLSTNALQAVPSKLAERKTFDTIIGYRKKVTLERALKGRNLVDVELKVSVAATVCHRRIVANHL